MRALILGIALAVAATPAFAEFTMSSPDVKSGSPMRLAQVNTLCKGQNISPALTWSGEPAGTKSFAITVFDSDARAGKGWWHWAVFDIPASVHGLPAGAGGTAATGLPAGAIQGSNDFKAPGYGGPCPPPADHAHHYEIRVYALKVATLPLNPNSPDAEIAPELRANALATAKIVARYGR
ncbi:MAG: YbhB/YbcL family Raf kinase inhibitor-like protein [Stellaceae bacterium]